MPFEVNQTEHCWIPLSDGTRLSARLWLPTVPGGAATPAILEYIPYRKRDMVRLRDERNHPVFAQNGFACVRVDMRGSGDSEGVMTDMYSSEELDDAIEVINWIAGRSWCNGCVGMMGTSWGGTSALQIAARRPEALKAIIAVCATNNRFEDDIHHMGGCLLTDTVEWGATLPAILASPPDPDTVGAGWREQWMQRLDELAFPLEHWVRHEIRDDYWRWGSVDEDPDAISCPVLAIGGWSDRYSNTVMNLLAAGHESIWGIVGPWGHHYPDQGCPGPAMGFQREAVRWWDRWLNNAGNNVEQLPRLRVWLQTYQMPQNHLATRPGRWIGEPTWPSLRVTDRPLWFSANGLRWEKTESSGSVTVPSNQPVGLAAGDTGYFGRNGGLPLDQRTDDRHALCFETAPLADAVEILGQVKLQVAFAADQPVATLVARLSDVPPEGEVARVSYCVRNLALNDKLSGRMEGEYNQLKSCQLDFHHIAYRFERGHRIRLALSDCYWPMIFPPPVKAKVILSPGDMVLTIPVREAGQENDSITMPDLLDDAPIASGTVCLDPPLERSVESPGQDGSYTLSWRQPRRRIRFPDLDLDFEYETTALHQMDPQDPCSASATFEHELRYVGADRDIRIRSYAKLTATVEVYHLRGSVSATENDEKIYERVWRPSVLRKFS